MITTFRTLCTVAVAHDYYRAGCRDFDFIVPAETAGVLRNGKLLAKMLNGELNVLYEADEKGAALLQLADATLRFGMKLLNPQFNNYTDFSIPKPLYRNSTASGSFDPALDVILTGRYISHTISKPVRPVTITVSDSGGQPVQTDTITAVHDRTTFSCDLSGKASGLYRVVENYPSSTMTVTYLSDSELLRSGVFGIVEIQIGAGLYKTPPSFSISYAAKKDILKYYLVVSNYTATEFDNLSVADNGYTEEGRPQIQFSKVASTAFSSDEIPSAMLAKSGEDVVLFKSIAPVPRQEQGRKKIQLSKNGDVLIKHLPQAGAGISGGDVIIHLSKP